MRDKTDSWFLTPNLIYGAKTRQVNKNMQAKSNYLEVERLIKNLGVGSGDVVGDLGTGTGYFTFEVAPMVGERGLVYSIDVKRSVVEHLRKFAQLKGLGNIKTIWSDLEIYGAAKSVKNNSLDYAFCVNVLHQSKKHKEIFSEAYRMMKPGAKLLVIEWNKNKTPFGPKIEERVNKQDVIKSAEYAGLNLEQDFEASKYHFGLIFSK